MSTNLDPSTWRLRTDGGIPYKLFEGHPTGSFDAGDAGMTEKYIILGSDFEAFLEESFPGAIIYSDDSWAFRRSRRCPHFNKLYTKGIAFEPFPSDKPGDPALIDAAAPEGTYSRFLTLTITYAGRPAAPGEAGDEEGGEEPTFREVSANAGAEFLMLNLANAVWETGPLDPVTEMDLRVPKLVPTTAWTIRYSNIDRRIVGLWLTEGRQMMGRVNSEVLPIFVNAPSETVLFLGLSASGSFSWRDWMTAPMTLELKFTEKNAGPDPNHLGLWIGHNHTYRKEAGRWDRLLMGEDHDRPIYETADLNQLIL